MKPMYILNIIFTQIKLLSGLLKPFGITELLKHNNLHFINETALTVYKPLLI